MACVLSGCGLFGARNRGESRQDRPAAEDGTRTRTLSDQISETRREDETVTRFDLNHDGKPDIFSYSIVIKGEDGKETQRLVRKEMDLNADGKIDINKFYDENEQVEKEAYDHDFDGKVDEINYFQKGVSIRKEFDYNFDGRTDLWVFLEKGRVTRKERDNNGDGRVDYWEYWENDVVDRWGEDLDGDGTVDRWTKNPESGARQ